MFLSLPYRHLFCKKCIIWFGYQKVPMRIAILNFYFNVLKKWFYICIVFLYWKFITVAMFAQVATWARNTALASAFAHPPCHCLKILSLTFQRDALCHHHKVLFERLKKLDRSRTTENVVKDNLFGTVFSPDYAKQYYTACIGMKRMAVG